MKSMFERRHYKLIAAAIKNAATLDDLVIDLCNKFTLDNPRFNAQRFIDACYEVEPEPVFVVTPSGEAALKWRAT